MKKLILVLLTFLSFSAYGQAEYEKIAITENVETASTSKMVSQQPGTGELNYINATALPISTPTQQALDMKLNISDLPTNLTLYPTTVTSDIPGYVKMVTDIHDPDYNTVAVDVSTAAITTTAQLVSQRISAPGVLVGQPGVFNITTFGNIRRLSGTGTATFYFEVYHRDLAGVETLICTSGISAVVSLSTYVEFTASGIWDDGDFLATDRIVIKSYANRIPGNSDPVYQFQFGGATPVRTILPVPFSVVDAGYELKANKQNSLANDGTGMKYPTVDAVNTLKWIKSNESLSLAQRKGDILYGILDQYTGEEMTLSKVTGTPTVNNIIYFQLGSEYFKRITNGFIDIKSFGAVSDADIIAFTGTDNTSHFLLAIQACSAAKIGLRISGNYAITPLTIAADGLIIDFEANSNLIGFSSLGINDRLITFGILAKNITVNAYNSYVRCPVFTSGEQRHIIQFVGCYNVNINGLECIGGGGDGFYIGNNALPLTENLILTDCKTDNSRRNGISLVNGINIKIIRSINKNAIGTYPMSGIDIEPNSEITGQLRNISIISPTTSGNGGHGILVSPGSLSIGESKILDVYISGHFSDMDGQDGQRGGFAVVGTGYSFPWANKQLGEIIYTKGIIKNSGGSGFYLNSFDPSYCPRVKADMLVIDAGNNATNDRDRCGALIYGSGGATFPNGNIELNIKVIDSRSVAEHYTAVYANNPIQPVNDVDITLDWDGRSVIGYGFVQSSIGSLTGKLKYNKKTKFNYTGAIPSSTTLLTTGGDIVMSNGGSVNLPKLSTVIGQVFSIENIAVNIPATIVPYTGEKILLNIDNQTGSLVLSTIGEFINLEATTLGWEVVLTNIKGRFVFTGGQPSRDIFWASQAPGTGTWTRGAIVMNTVSSNEGNLGWVCTTAGTPGTWIPMGKIGADVGKLSFGTTVNRPTPSQSGFLYFDTTLGKPIWWNGVVWKEGVLVNGTSSQFLKADGSVDSTVYSPTTSPTFTGTPTAPTATAGTNTTQIATTAFVQAATRPYKVYTALLSQSGTSAPTATILENTLGGSVVWSYSSTGVYYATLTGAFLVNKSIAFVTGIGFNKFIGCQRLNDNVMQITSVDITNSPADTTLISTAIEIRVYN